MNLLLDTQALLWWLDDDPTLSDTARSAIASFSNVVFVSAVSIWEITIKSAVGKLTVPDDFESVVATEPFRRLSITWEHAFGVRALPPHHRDPFDRMLISQSQIENLTLVTRDSDIRKYGVHVLEA